MSSLSRITKNSTYNLLTNIASKLITLVITILLARYFGAEVYGRWSFVFAFVGLFAVFGDFGLGLLLKRTVAREKNNVNTHFSSALLISTLLNFVTVILILVAGFILNYDSTTYKLLMLGALFITFQNFKIPFKAVYEAYEKMQLVFYSRTAKMVLRIVAVFILVLSRQSLEVILLMYTLIEFITIGLDFYLYNVHITRLKFRRHNIRPIFMQMIPFGVGGLFMTIYDKVDITLLSKLLTNNVDLFIGWYSASYELMAALIFIPMSITSAIMPLAYTASKKKLKKIYTLSYQLLFSLAIPLCVGVFMFAFEIIDLIYGSDFLGAVLPLQILIWATLFNFGMFISGIALNSLNLERETMKATIHSVIFNVVANIVLIPYYGFLAAAITTIGSVMIYNVYCFKIIRKKFIRLHPLRELWKSLVATAIMVIVLSLFSLYFLIEIIIGIVVFTVVFIVILKGVDFEDFKKHFR